ncbi:hypothetical protein [Fusobacterium varium]|mgnify:FL=1|uniref:hypothetical protein n=1 Tax=Fusobacterium varium TaxID=856 RepID=UPI0024320C3D|nr:hypothetical protein [Fusobacterium varium]MCF0171649.1 hypothetical protein [Fusobacterium varium]MCF0188837.1 hypothetical protein [Bacteroidaceae bacterium]
MILFFILCFIGLFYKIWEILNLKKNIKFLETYNIQLSELPSILKSDVMTSDGSITIHFLTSNLNKYLKLVNPKSYYPGTNLPAISVTLKNFMKTKLCKSPIVINDYIAIIFAITSDTTSAIGELEENKKWLILKLIPIFYISNVLEMISKYFFLIFPFNINFTFRKFVTFFAEICGILEFFIALFPAFSLHLTEKLTCIINFFF